MVSVSLKDGDRAPQDPGSSEGKKPDLTLCIRVEGWDIESQDTKAQAMSRTC